jgi:uncharacterized delta-60 repeat protein
MQNVAKRKHALLALMIVLSPAMVRAQSSAMLDPTFGTGGKVTTDFAGTVAVQADGKLVMAGGATTANFGAAFAVERFNSNGALDASFGTGGKVTTDFGGRFGGVTSVALQPDGKIVAAGGFVVGLFNEFALARYNSDGTLDANFGTGGKVLTDFGVSAQAFSVAVQPDGKIVVGGYANLDGGENFEVVRYNSNGTLDATFGADGKVTTTFGVPQQGFSYALAYSLALQQDGKIVLAGEATVNGDRDFALARYNSNGTLDPSFGTGGRVTTTFGKVQFGTQQRSNDVAFSVAVQPDGKIVTAGFGLFKFALARYNSNGTLDPSFGTGGQVTTAIAGLNDGAERLALQGDGKIVVAGRSFINGDFHSALVRYNSNGTLDAGFGTATAIFGGESDHVAIAVQPDGKIVVPGSSFTGSNESFGLARFNSGSASNATANATAGFVRLDTTTGGSWEGVYGLDGYTIIGNNASAPSYGTATPAGNNTYVWSGSTGETRALQKASPATDRIAACWYSNSVFTIDLNFGDASQHQFAIYMLDWDSWGGGRTQRVEVFDANNQLLDTRMVSGFTGGQFLVWNLSGHVTIRVTNTNPNGNAVVSGLFFR